MPRERERERKREKCGEKLWYYFMDPNYGILLGINPLNLACHIIHYQKEGQKSNNLV